MAAMIRRQGSAGGGGVGAAIGTGLGALAGVVAAPFTGGSSLSAIPTLMSVGGAAGGAVGTAAAPASQAKEIPGPSAMERRFSDGANDPSSIVQDSLAALNEMPRHIQDEYRPPLEETQNRLRKFGG